MSRFARSTSVLLLAGVSLVNAQFDASDISSFSLSQDCQSALLQVAASPEASCLNVGALPSLFQNIGQNVSLIPAMDNWLQGACSQDPCTNETLSDIVTTLATSCTVDLTEIGIDDSQNTISEMVTIVQESFVSVQQIACLKETTNNTLCATSLLDEYEAIVGTLSIDNIVSQLPMLLTGQIPNIPTYITCSDCVKQAYNVLMANEPDIASQTIVTSTLQGQCGSDFTDGTAPSEIVEGTGSAVPSLSADANGALSVPRNALMGAAAASLVTVFSAFAVLA